MVVSNTYAISTSTHNGTRPVAVFMQQVLVSSVYLVPSCTWVAFTHAEGQSLPLPFSAMSCNPRFNAKVHTAYGFHGWVMPLRSAVGTAVDCQTTTTYQRHWHGSWHGNSMAEP